MAVINTIYEAIGDRRVLAFVYNGTARTAEPYVVGYDGRGCLMLSAVQRSGGSGRGFRTYKVDELSFVALTDLRFSGSHPDYNPRDPYFERVLRRI